MPVAKSKLQRKAALRAADILASMGSGGFNLQGVDARTAKQFGADRKSTEPLVSPNPVEMTNAAVVAANETRKRNRQRAGAKVKPGTF